MVLLWSGLPLLGALCCVGLALFVLSRNPRHRVHQSFALGMLALASMEFGQFMAMQAESDSSSVFWEKVALAGEVFLPGPWLAFSAAFGRTNPAQHLAQWRVGLWASATLSFIALAILSRGGFVTDGLALDRWGFWFSVFLLLAFTTVVANFERTLRAADRSQRWRIKYFVVGIVCIMIVMIYALSQTLLFSAVEPSIGPLVSTAILIGCGLMTFSLVRHRLLDVDVFVSRYVVYNSVTVLAVGGYLLAVGAAAQAIKSQGSGLSVYLGSLLVVVGFVALGIILLSYTIRKRLKVFVDRHFFKSKYDYRKEWLELTERLSSKPTVEAIAPALAAVIFETFWIKHMILWLADDGEREFRVVYGEASPPNAMRWDPASVAALAARDYPMLLGAPAGHPQRLALDDPQRTALDALNVRILVPLMVQRRVIGILGLSPSRSGFTLGDEDYDLLRTMTKQAAGNLFNAQLSRQLVSSKEMEAFHCVSAFLLHDVKNLVSMLSLLVDNMRRNFDNPAFRQDALASLSQTVEKMTRLMDRLRALSRRPEPVYEAVDLNALARAVLAELSPSLRSKPVSDFQEVPLVRADPAQLKQVLTNLVLNAEEAIARDGEIRVATRVEDGMVACSVSDNGQGIAPEFLRTRIFKPFATTKSQGFGIGLYQSKTIVEAHGGRVRVQSRVGEGSTLTFSIPATTDKGP